MIGFKRAFSAAAMVAASFLCTLEAAHAHPLSAYEPEEWIPYRIDYQGWITVNASVNGSGPHDFILDSGATITSVFANLSAGQDFPPADRGPIRILGLASAKALPAHILGEIKVGSLSLENHVGVILPDWTPADKTPQGVIGLDLLTRNTVMIDEERGRVEFYAPNAEPQRRVRSWSRTSLKPLAVSNQDTPLHQITMQVSGVKIPCIVDLGASGTIFNPAALRSMQSGLYVNSYGSRSPTSASRLDDIFGDSSKAVAAKIRRVKIGGARWSNKTFLVYDAEIFRELGAASKPFCLVGMDLFADRSIIFDFTNEDFYIGPALQD